MGRTFTPAYAVEYRTDNGAWTPACWNYKQEGRPTAANLVKHVAGLEASTRPGGCNEHLGATKILAARILKNKGQRDLVVAYAIEPSSRLMGWVLAGIKNDPTGIEFAYGTL